MTTEPTTRDETKVAELRAKIIEEGKKLTTAECLQGSQRATFTSLVKEAIEAGATVEEIKEWGKEAHLTPQTVNLALRKAGIRQRGERSDKGKSKSGAVTVPGDPPSVPAGVVIEPPKILSAEKWTEALLAALSGDREAAGEFINEMIQYLLK